MTNTTKEPRKLYGIRMRIELADRVREQGKKERRSLANMIEVACERYLSGSSTDRPEGLGGRPTRSG